MSIEYRIRAAIDRITSGHGCMRIPAEETDPDLVLADCLSEIARLRAPQWLPIESAPRDGTTIIGFSAAVGEPMLVRFIAPHEFLTTGECEMQLNVSDDADLKAAEDWLNTEAWFYADFSAGDICDSACQPTHWQQLPAPPEVQP